MTRQPKTLSLDELFEQEEARNTTPQKLAEADAQIRRSAANMRALIDEMIASGKLQPDGQPWDTPEEDEDEEDEDEEDEE